MERNIVKTLTSVMKEGKKIACLSGNRNLDEKIVKAKMKSLGEYEQLVHAIVVDATDAINQGMDVYNYTTGNL